MELTHTQDNGTGHETHAGDYLVLTDRTYTRIIPLGENGMEFAHAIRQIEPPTVCHCKHKVAAFISIK